MADSGPQGHFKTAALSGGAPAAAVPAPSTPTLAVPGLAVPALQGVPAVHMLPKRCAVCQGRYPADFNVCPRDATPLENEDGGPDPFVGKVLGETYQVVRLVGEGGMGKVYEARHLRLKDRRFAVKVLHAEFARQAEVVSRFQREAESASAIDHPNVIDVFDVHTTQDGIPYLVGEFLEGEELGAYLERAGQLEVSVAVAIARQVCRALAAAHARGIVHRDMKPENVFITQRDGATTIKVLDFGISKAGSRETNLTRTGMIMGTPSYMAPEQARGDKVDHRADVYAIGALLYQTLTGHRPFDSEDAASTLTMVLTLEPARPRSLNPAVPAALELVIQRAMAKDPRDRYQNTAELDFALAPFDVPGGALQPLIAPADGLLGTSSAPVNVTARTMMAGPGGSLSGGPISHAGTATDARRARPTIIVLSIALALWLIGGAVDAFGGVVRYVREGDLTSTESVMLVIGCVFAVLTPMVLFIRTVKRTIWPNTVRAVELAGDLKRTATAAFATYGGVAILSRATFTVILRDSSGLTSGFWDAMLFALSVLGAVIAGGVGPLARSFRRKANQ